MCPLTKAVLVLTESTTGADKVSETTASDSVINIHYKWQKIIELLKFEYQS